MRSASLITLFLLPTVACAVEYEDDVLPILEDHCLKCHGPDTQKAGLRVDQRLSLLRGGDGGFPSLVPGDAAKSHLIERIRSGDASLQMPPKGKRLSEEEIEVLERWIRDGAEWPGQMQELKAIESNHWSFAPVVRPGLPAPPEGSPNPIDSFVNAELAEKGLTANGPAEPRSLIRRVSTVLTGLLPEPRRVARFVSDYEADPEGAYEGLVDELLSSPHFGERWAQHWLDVIRWAESNGSESNLYRKNAWHYRDYVVRAFNEDRPYDQFIREQIAGDSLGSGEATGFLVAGPHVPAATVGREPSAIRQARADRMDEILQTVGASVMGITIGCARCHNHKFDPISITDYYAMAAVFQDVEFGSRFPELDPAHPRRKQGEALWSKIAEQRRKLRRTGGWEEDWGAFREWHFGTVETSAIRLRFKNPSVTVDELQVFGPAKRNANLAHQGKGVRVLGFPPEGNEGRNPVERVNDGDFGTMAWRGRMDQKSKEKPWIQLDFGKTVKIDRLRLSSNREYYLETDYLTQKPYLPRYDFDLEIHQLDGKWKPAVGTWYLTRTLNERHPERKNALAEIQKLISRLSEEGPQTGFVGRLIPPEVTHVLHRGSPESPRDEVAPAGIDILKGRLGLDSQTSGARRRAEFSGWLADSGHPLTARVMVNRIWHHVFGTGIVATPSDFGSAGAPPSHPQLLDWLAAEFVSPTRHQTKPWSMRGMIRMMVMSKSFRRSSHPSQEASKVDAGSRLLWRFPPRRVAAEVLRDSILQASGKLDRRIGGRSYRIHNVKKTYAQWEVVDNHGPGTWRRMLYQERMRRVDDQIFTAFDFPDCGQVRAKRPISTTPLQALNLMNSPFVVEQSKFIAARAEKEGGDDKESRVRWLFEALLSRSPQADEMKACENVALQLVARSLLNSNEFGFLP